MLRFLDDQERPRARIGLLRGLPDVALYGPGRQGRAILSAEGEGGLLILMTGGPTRRLMLGAMDKATGLELQADGQTRGRVLLGPDGQPVGPGK